MEQSKKIIYADDLREAIREDRTIRGSAFAAVMHHINNASAVEVAPVIHARWVEKDDAVMHCSRCDRVGNPHIDNYCPRCGAIMDLPKITDTTAAALERIGQQTHGEG